MRSAARTASAFRRCTARSWQVTWAPSAVSHAAGDARPNGWWPRSNADISSTLGPAPWGGSAPWLAGLAHWSGERALRWLHDVVNRGLHERQQLGVVLQPVATGA